MFSFLDLSNPEVVREVLVVTAAVITLVGTRLSWTAPRHRMSIEERTKDGELTEEQARRKIRLSGWSGPALVIVGVALLAVAITR